MAAIAVFCASDTRFSHLSLCREDLALSGLDLACSPDEVCCAEDAAVPGTASLDVLDCDSCLCCSQAPTPHQGESDVRSPIGRNPAQADVVLALLSAPLPLDRPPFATKGPRTVARPAGGAARFLLCNHLRF